jgi:hypothetical protein
MVGRWHIIRKHNPKRTDLVKYTAAGQPTLDAALETLVGEILVSIVEGAFCTVQEWDNRIDCCLKLDDGTIVGEMVSLSGLNAQVIQAVGARLKLRRSDVSFKLQNELSPPVRISPSL